MLSQVHDLHELSDIPGTTVFTAQMSRKGFHLNQFCMSLMQAENRDRFRADELAYMADWPLTETQKAAIVNRDYLAMIAEGGNVYFLAKIGSTDGLAFQKVAASMSGLTQDGYADMMLAGGRSPEGNRSIRDKR
jgi:protocatechuate 4,5-dioxygenase, alpha chain